MSNYGAYVNGRRPKSKKAIKDALVEGAHVRFDSTSMHGDTSDLMVIDGVLVRDSDGTPYLGKPLSIVGPDPYTARNFYGTVSIVKDRVVVK